MLLFSHRPYRLPLSAPLRTAHGTWAEREGLLVRIEDAAGRVGFGEIAPIPWFGTETLAQAEAACAGLGGRVAPDALAAIPERLGCVRFAVASALEEIEGRSEGTPAPLHAASVGTGVPPLRPDRLPVAALLPAGKAALAALPA